MRQEKVRLCVDGFHWDGKEYSAGEIVVVPEHQASLIVQEGRAAWTHQVKCLKPVFDGRRTHAAGDVVELSREQAIGFHAAGKVEVLEPDRIENLPALPSGPVEEPDPYPDDPRIFVEIRRPVLFRSHSYARGDVVQVPERVAGGWIGNGLARMERGEGWSARGRRYLQELVAYLKSPAGHQPRY